MSNTYYSVVGNKYNYFDLRVHSTESESKTHHTVPIDAEHISPAKWGKSKSALSYDLILKIMGVVGLCLTPVVLYYGMAFYTIGAIGATLLTWAVVKSYLWPAGSSASLDHALYTNILIGGSGLVLPNANNSSILQYLYQFLSTSEGVPASVLKELKECTEWQTAIDKILKDASDFQNARLSLTPIAQSIKSRIESLAINESCLIPGGVAGKLVLYRITHTDARNYEFQILSRDPSIQRCEVLPIPGREKIRLGTTFGSINLQELTEVNWLHSLLSLQMPDQEGIPGRNSLTHLLDRFQTRILAPSSPRNLGFHKPRSQYSAISTIWSYVQDLSGGSKSTWQRRKLRLQAQTLFRYAEWLSQQREISSTAKDYVAEAVRRLDQKMLTMLEKGDLSDSEYNWLASEVKRVSHYVESSRESLQKSIFEARLEISRPPEVVPPEACMISNASAAAAKVDHAVRTEAVPFPENAALRLKLKQEVLPPLDQPKTVIEALESIVKEVETITDPLALQYRLMRVCFALPLQPTAGKMKEYSRDVVENPNDPWRLLSAENRVKASALLVQIASELTAKAQATNSLLPDRVLSILKIGSIIEHLAYLNKPLTHYDLKRWGSQVGSHVRAMVMPSYHRTLYRQWSEEEGAVVVQLQGFYNYCHALFESNSYGSYLDSVERKEISANEQAQHLNTMGHLILSINGLEAKTYCYSYIENRVQHNCSYVSGGSGNAFQISRWGRHIASPALLGAAYGFWVSQGSATGPRKDGIEDHSHWLTQEAVMENHQELIKRSFDRWLEDKRRSLGHHIQADLQSSERDFSAEELRDLLVTMQPFNAVTNILGLIDQNPSYLSNPDVCSLIEILFLDNSDLVFTHRGLERQNIQKQVSGDPTLKQFLAEFFERHITAFAKRNEFGPALFLVHLSQSIGQHLHVAEMPDYRLRLRQWILDAFMINAPGAPFRHTMLAEYLFNFVNKTELNQRELHELVLFYFHYENSAAHPLHHDPVLQDSVRKIMRRWIPEIEKAFTEDPVLLAHTLDRICRLHGTELPSGTWSGHYPSYHAGNLSINLLTGAIEQINDQGLFHLSSEVMNHPLFQQAFPEIYQSRSRMLKVISATGTIFSSTDRKIRIEVRAGQVYCYRKHPERDNWLQAVDKNFLQHSGLPDSFSSNVTFIAVDNPMEIWRYSPQGIPQFKFGVSTRKDEHNQFNRYYIVEMDDRRPGNEWRQKMQPVAFHPVEQPEFRRLAALEDPKSIILWTKDGVLNNIECARLGLCFDYHDHTLTCRTEPYVGYTVNLHPTDAMTYGLQAGIVLEHPSRPTLMLLPNTEGTYRSLTPNANISTMPRLWQIIKLWVCSKFFPNSLEEGTSANQLHPIAWMQNGSGGGRFWVIEKRGDVPHVRIPADQEAKCWFEVLCHATMATQRPSANPFALAKRALQELDRLLPRAFSNDDIVFMRDRLLTLIPSNDLRSDPNGDATALVLQCLLILHAKAGRREKKRLEIEIAKGAQHYFSRGKRISCIISLTREQMAQCLSMMIEHIPNFDPRPVTAILDHEKNSKEPSKFDIESHCNPFFDRFDFEPGELLKAKDVLEGIFKDPYRSMLSRIRCKMDSNTSDSTVNAVLHAMPNFLSRNRTLLLERFKEIYAVAQKGKSAGEEFVKLRYTFQALPGDDRSHRNGEATVLAFLGLLFELKTEQPELQLPNIPTLEYPTGDYWKQTQEERERDDEIRKKTGETLDAFLKNVVEVVSQSFAKSKIGQAEPAFGKMRVEIDHTKGAQEAKAALKRIAPSRASIDELEKMLKETSVIAIAPIYAPQVGDCVFSEKEMREFFERPPHSTVNNFSLRGLHNSQEPVVKFFATQFEEEMDNYVQAMEKEASGKDENSNRNVAQWQVKDAAAVAGIGKLLNDKAASLKQQLEPLKSEILKLVSVPTTVRAEGELRARYRTPVEWDALMTAYFQDTVPEFLRISGYGDVECGIIKKSLTEYLILSTKSKYVTLCCLHFEEMQKDGLVQNPHSGKKLYEMLTRCRAYDTNQHARMLVIEEVMGFIMTEKQLEIVSGFITDPTSIRRAITGEGKTSIILLLTAFMMADGKHLISLRFLSSLLPENLAHFQRVLGGVLKKRITPLQFSMNTSLVYKRKVNGVDQQESAFKEMYRQALLTIVERGCLVTDRSSQPFLQAKFINLVRRAHMLPPGESLPAMDREHIIWLSKLLLLLEETQLSIFDEFDKALKPKDKIHLQVSQGQEAPEFLWKTTLEIFDVLLGDRRLNILGNLQAELRPEERKKCLSECASILAKQWCEKYPALNGELLTKYFRSESESESFFKEIEAVCTRSECDALALTKDLLKIYFPITLAKSSLKDYMRSQNGVDVAPCEYLGIVKEKYQFEDLRERIPYVIQDYFQNGLTFKFFEHWIQGLKKDAVQQMEKAQKSDTNDTPANRQFQSYFPTRSLDTLTHNDLAILHNQVRNTPALIRRFLLVLLPQIRMSGAKISMDSQNIVSMSKATAGTSATLGCAHGLHRQFKVADDRHHFVRARMMDRFIKRMAHQPALLQYDPARPTEMVKQLHDQDGSMKVLIDGAGACIGLPAETAAEQMGKLTGLQAVGYFDNEGNSRVLGKVDAAAEHRGQMFPHSQARGADVRLAASLHAVLTSNGRISIEQLLQNEGRLRNGNRMRVAVPSTSGITNCNQLFERCVEVDAREYAADTMSKALSEPRDIIRKSMVRRLAERGAKANFKGLIEDFEEMNRQGILVSNETEDWSTPGSYYDRHKHIEVPSTDPVGILQANQQRFIQMARKLTFEKEAAEISAISYVDLAGFLPSEVYEKHITDQEAEVDAERETEAQREAENEVEKEHEHEELPDPTAPYPIGYAMPGSELHLVGVNFVYLPDRYREHSFKILHAAYDSELYFTENYLPLDRNEWAAREYRRRPHDRKQNNLGHILFTVIYGHKEEKDQKSGTLVQKPYIQRMMALAGDLYDASHGFAARAKSKHIVEGFEITKDKFEYAERFVYDIKLRRSVAHLEKEGEYNTTKHSYDMIDVNKVTRETMPKELLEEASKRIVRMTAQMRFENKQMNDYSPEEAHALTEWFREQGAKGLETLKSYFEREVLRVHPKQRDEFRHSQLHDLFEKVLSSL